MRMTSLSAAPLLDTSASQKIYSARRGSHLSVHDAAHEAMTPHLHNKQLYLIQYNHTSV